MTRPRSKFSLGEQITWTVLAANAVGITVACALLMYFGARREFQAEIHSLTDLIGMQSVIALSTGNVDQANTALLAATSQDRLEAAIVYDVEGELFAQFRRDYDSASPPESAPPIGEYFTRGIYSLTVPIVAGGKTFGFVYVRVSAKNLWSERMDYAALALLAALVSCIPTIITLRQILRRLAKPIGEMADRAERLSRGDLTGEPIEVRDEELAVLASGINEMTEQLGKLVRRASAESVEITRLSEGLDEISARIELKSAGQKTSVEAVSKVLSMFEIGQKEGIVALKALAPSSAKAASSVGQIQSASKLTSDKGHQLSDLISSVSASMIQNSKSVRQVASNAASQSSSTEKALKAVADLKSSIDNATLSARSGLELSEKSSYAAEQGQIAVQRAGESILEVDAHFEKIRDVVKSLSERSDSISGVVGVIDAVTDETKLLALNASIIAAQAGLHGGAFSVVAKEVRELAERTANSSNEIAALVAVVQSEIVEAVSAVDAGGGSIAEGRQRSDEAASVLEEILAAASETAQTATSIVQGSEFQFSDLRIVDEAISDVREGARQVESAVVEQERASVEIATSLEHTEGIGAELLESMERQNTACERIIQSVFEIDKRAQQMHQVSAQYEDSEGEIVAALNVFRDNAGSSLAESEKLRDFVSQFRDRSRALTAATQAFNGGD